MTIIPNIADPYALSAEFYDVMAAPHWETKRAILVEALTGSGPITAPIVDIGAGSGLSTMTIAEAVPEVPIHAVEPSAAMRAALVSRLLTHADHAARVTVHPDIAEEVTLPETVGAAVLFGVIGYLDRPARQRFWAQLSARLTPHAPVVVEFMPLDRPQPVPEMMIAKQRIGQRDNEIHIRGEPADAESQRWTMRYVVREGEAIVREFTADHLWRTVGIDELSREAGEHGMTCEQLSPIIALLRAP
ncbi:class I SAM-dependent methyltransferase [Nocardia cyriacigeorgica]|uniref:Class I SAM-dependent methyltransferase n=1 Tax=Nocardia cyriacigeorgica TaxID=135487 RepID=A0A6P1D1B6_9NOCA|nr:class I SAM-dependent methyltransferase [Nocardia cyriacigeorgica]NEW44295.1 class I SAM-dependent methyltransferase [Nocardia cyriacigeorgica]NEW51166.1 class I SAM-dependent methyltransferase [Nocardia cyriacigeorgica]